ncbi:FadR/GntR family transcriptional regulator [Enterococcus sp. BWR-S5]|uniref:FadR/GntR family transcriptional regulator n=1 Tax=Enterococcus sp. BWR-S5 TaxID=2787714 RepID=UPI00192197F4|nr:FadR/GntR family transcriptional regulator [Enterococcus sp. BWR-S5]MBL1226349.1 FadR family transcriptional regulator [Enterococcus sp. BWR-S5]
MGNIGKKLPEQVADTIIEYIHEHDLQVGDRLPNEYDLAKELNVGRSTIREAVRSLASRNVLEVRQGAGTFISKKRGIADDPLGFGLVKDTLKLTKDLFEIRYILEPRVAALAATNATDEEIQAIDQVRLAIEEAMDTDTQLQLNLDVEFHSLIAKASNNVAMHHLIPVINESMFLYNDRYTNQRVKEETLLLHREIVEAIKKHDSNAAFDAMTVHMAYNRMNLNQFERSENE